MRTAPSKPIKTTTDAKSRPPSGLKKTLLDDKQLALGSVGTVSGPTLCVRRRNEDAKLETLASNLPTNDDGNCVRTGWNENSEQKEDTGSSTEQKSTTTCSDRNNARFFKPNHVKSSVTMLPAKREHTNKQNNSVLNMKNDDPVIVTLDDSDDENINSLNNLMPSKNELKSASRTTSASEESCDSDEDLSFIVDRFINKNNCIKRSIPLSSRNKENRPCGSSFLERAQDNKTTENNAFSPTKHSRVNSFDASHVGKSHRKNSSHGSNTEKIPYLNYLNKSHDVVNLTEANELVPCRIFENLCGVKYLPSHTDDLNYKDSADVSTDMFEESSNEELNNSTFAEKESLVNENLKSCQSSEQTVSPSVNVASPKPISSGLEMTKEVLDEDAGAPCFKLVNSGWLDSESFLCSPVPSAATSIPSNLSTSPREKYSTFFCSNVDSTSVPTVKKSTLFNNFGTTIASKPDFVNITSEEIGNTLLYSNENGRTPRKHSISSFSADTSFSPLLNQPSLAERMNKRFGKETVSALLSNLRL